MIVGTKVKIKSRPYPKNNQVGEIVYIKKDTNNRWLTYVDYPNGERYIAIDGIDKIIPAKNETLLKRLMEEESYENGSKNMDSKRRKNKRNKN